MVFTYVLNIRKKNHLLLKKKIIIVFLIGINDFRELKRSIKYQYIFGVFFFLNEIFVSCYPFDRYTLNFYH